LAIKKSDLYRSLWASCDELRGGMDASQYKDYVLTLLFVKYVSDKHAADPNSLVDVPEDGSFAHLLTLRGKAKIGDEINKAIGRLAEANNLRGIIDQADFDDPAKLGDGKDMVDRLSKLLNIFQNRLDFSDNQAAGDDLLGDAYEYLMRHFATESGKSKGQFYTPAEVSRILAQVVGIGADTTLEHTVYDPTCGSGSLLLKAGDQARGNITIYGQERDTATWGLAVMNAFLHGQPTAELRPGNTLSAPAFHDGSRLKTFDFVVANPPFSDKGWTSGVDPANDEFGRFEYGVPPTKNGDYAFLLHIITSLNSTGTGAVVLPHGVLFRGNAEASIRRELLNRGLIKGIIGLPPNLFYGTGIPACIVVVDKAGAASRDHLFMIDASHGFVKDGAKNRLRSQDIHKIVDVFTNEIEVERYSRRVPLTEIADPKNDFNLNLPRYIDSSAPEDIQDLHAHLRGGIPERDIDALGEFWSAFPQLRQQLFCPNRPGYVDLAVTPDDLHEAVLSSMEVQKFTDETSSLVDDWFDIHRPALAAISADTLPHDLIRGISEDLLARFRSVPLVDEYDVYEQLMRYWHEVMHDDVFLIMQEGWKDAARPRKAIDDKNNKLSETADLEIGTGKKKSKYKMDLVPPSLVVARYFPDEQARIDALNVEAEQCAEALQEFIEEHGTDEESLLADALTDKGTLTQRSTKDALDAAKLAADDEGVACLRSAMSLMKSEAAAKKEAREAQRALDELVLAKYGDLTDGDVQALVLNSKWLVAAEAGLEAETDALIGELVTRIRQLGERYADTLGDLEQELGERSEAVQGHLASMGVLS